MSPLLASLAAGLALGLQFNPVASLVGAAGAAVVAGRRGAGRVSLFAGAGVAVGAWVAGDGLRQLSILPRQAGPATVEVGAAMLICLLVGYALPALAGAYVGRRVTRGFGWPSAAAVAVAVSGALALVSDRLAGVALALSNAVGRG